MPEPRRRSALHLTLLAALALPSESIPASAPPPPDRWPAYLHAHISSIADRGLLPILPAAPAHACADENLHFYLAKWQRLLLLDEWRISIYCGLPVGQRQDVEGYSTTIPKHLLAYVYIRPDAASPLEETVLHELLHVALIDAERAARARILDPKERLVELLTARIYRSYAQ